MKHTFLVFVVFLMSHTECFKGLFLTIFWCSGIRFCLMLSTIIYCVTCHDFCLKSAVTHQIGQLASVFQVIQQEIRRNQRSKKCVVVQNITLISSRGNGKDRGGGGVTGGKGQAGSCVSHCYCLFVQNDVGINHDVNEPIILFGEDFARF